MDSLGSCTGRLHVSGEGFNTIANSGPAKAFWDGGGENKQANKVWID
jgi:Ser/Thr protein kinase RdoA (MazF antagonist)